MGDEFLRSYEFEKLDELPSSGSLTHYYYPDGTTRGGRDGVLLRIQPRNRDPWIGTFAFGKVSRIGLSLVLATPHPDRICVVANGQGYIVDAGSPKDWEMVRAVPITDVRIFLACGLIVFADYSTLFAYDNTGAVGNFSVSGDEITITEVTDSYIVGTFWSPPRRAKVPFLVDLELGKCEGGDWKPLK